MTHCLFICFQVKQIFAADPELAAEIEYDLKDWVVEDPLPLENIATVDHETKGKIQCLNELAKDDSLLTIHRISTGNFEPPLIPPSFLNSPLVRPQNGGATAADYVAALRRSLAEKRRSE